MVRSRHALIVEALARPRAEHAILARLVEHIATGDPAQLCRLRPRPSPLPGVAGRECAAGLAACRPRRSIGDELGCALPDVSRPGLSSVAARADRRSLTLRACLAGYDVEFDRLVEATFRPAASLRSCDDTRYCQAGPSNAEHVEAQLVLRPGSAQTLDLDLLPGAYRIWVQRGCRGVQLVASDGGPAQVEVRLGALPTR